MAFRQLPIDDSVVHSILDKGFEPVRVGVPGINEWYFANDELIYKERSHESCCAYAIIVEKIHKWPDVLKPGWVAIDSNGKAYWFSGTPRAGRRVWETVVAEWCCIDCLNIDYPPYDDWKDACWRVP